MEIGMGLPDPVPGTSGAAIPGFAALADVVG